MSRLEASGASGPRPEGCRLATCNPQVAPLITHTVPFEQFPEAYEMASNYTDGVIKAVLTFDNHQVLCAPCENEEGAEAEAEAKAEAKAAEAAAERSRHALEKRRAAERWAAQQEREASVMREAGFIRRA